MFSSNLKGGYYTFLFPEGLDLPSLLNKVPIGLKGFQIEKLYYILDVILQSSAFGTGAYDETGAVPLNSAILRDVIGRRYNEYLDYLVGTNVLDTNGSFSRATHSSRKYSISSAYGPGVDTVTIPITVWLSRKLNASLTTTSTAPSLSQSLLQALPIHRTTLSIRDYNDFQAYMRYKHEPVYKWIKAGGLQIDKNQALIQNRNLYTLRTSRFITPTSKWNKKLQRFIKKTPRLQAFANNVNISNLINKKDAFIVDTNVFRTHTTLTAITKDLRGFITWKAEPLVCVDISNCQPLLLSALTNPDFWSGENKDINTTIHSLNYNKNYINNYPIKPIITLCNFFRLQKPHDVAQFCSMVSEAKFYEGIQQLILSSNAAKDGLTRDEIKTMMFTVLFSDIAAKNHNWAKNIRTFNAIFPNLCNLINLIKQQEAKNLPLLLQRLESFIMYERILPEITRNYPRLPVFTIHDSIVTLKGYEHMVRDTIIQQLYLALGVKGSCKFEYWTPINSAGPVNMHLALYEQVQEHYFHNLHQDFIAACLNEMSQ